MTETPTLEATAKIDWKRSYYAEADLSDELRKQCEAQAAQIAERDAQIEALRKAAGFAVWAWGTTPLPAAREGAEVSMPEALQLAHWLENELDPHGTVRFVAATELRRLQARAESAEAERDRLVAEVARQVEARDAVAAAEYRLIGELCAARAERDRLRDALIACRPAVYLRLGFARNATPASPIKNETAMLSALLDTIDAAAAAKGQG
jgi:hypothetical protein